MHRILIIEDDVPFCQMLELFLKRKSFAIDATFSATEAKKRLQNQKYDLILTDLRLPDQDGLSLVSEFKRDFPDTPVVLMTGYSDINTAVKAMKNGAADYISKPFNPDEVLIVLQNALAAQPDQPTSAAPEPTNYIIGISAESRKLSQYIDLVAPTDMSVLIIGESGTGKEIIAQKIHENSQRKNENFIAVDCGTIPKDLASSEFFGHTRGSFTGALSDKMGYFEAAHKGTLFLDEIGNLSYENQIRLLRALQERKIKPVGSNKEIPVDIRIITATNEDLREAVKNETFRADLYHRINEFSIQSPALREREEDIILFAEFFLEKANRQLGKSVLGFSPEVIAIFERYPWPGNLREMQNIIKRAVLLTKGDLIQTAALPQELTAAKLTTAQPDSLSETEKQAIISALEKSGNNKSKAARSLNITRKTLYNKLNQFGLDY